MVDETYANKMIGMMQQELDEIKKTLLAKSGRKPTSLRGICKGVDISDEEIEEAKRSLFNGINIDQMK